MIRLIGVANTSADFVLTLMQDLGYKSSTILVHTTGQPLPETPPKQQYILLLSYSDFVQGISVLNTKAYATKTVLLFAPAVRLENLRPVILLDMLTKKRELVKSTFVPVTEASLQTALVQELEAKKKLKVKNEEYLAVLIDNVKKGSLLNPLMTLLYALRASSRIKTEDAIFTWLFSEATVSELEDKLSDLACQHPLTKKLRSSVIELFNSELGISYKKAFEQIGALKHKQKSADKVVISYKNIAKKHGVATYELAYIAKRVYARIDTSIVGKTLHTIYKGKSRNNFLKNSVDTKI